MSARSTANCETGSVARAEDEGDDGVDEGVERIHPEQAGRHDVVSDDGLEDERGARNGDGRRDDARKARQAQRHRVVEEPRVDEYELVEKAGRDVADREEHHHDAAPAGGGEKNRRRGGDACGRGGEAAGPEGGLAGGYHRAPGVEAEVEVKVKRDLTLASVSALRPHRSLCRMSAMSGTASQTSS